MSESLPTLDTHPTPAIPLPLPTPENTGLKIILDGNGNHHVMDNILRFCDRSTLFAWRQVNSRFQNEADSILARHVVFQCRTYTTGDPNVSTFDLVDPMGRSLPGWREAVVFIRDVRSSSPQVIFALTQIRLGRHVRILDCPLAWATTFAGDNPPATPFPHVTACRIWYEQFPRDLNRFAKPAFTYDLGLPVESTAVVFGQLHISDPFSCCRAADRNQPRKAVYHFLPRSGDMECLDGPILYAKRQPPRWGAHTALVLVFPALDSLDDPECKTVVFANIYYVLEAAKAAGCSPTSITFVGLEAFLEEDDTPNGDSSDGTPSGSNTSNGLRSDRTKRFDHSLAAPNIIDRLRVAGDWYPYDRPDDKQGDRGPICKRAIPYLANLMETGRITNLSLEEYAATLTEKQRLIELVPSASNLLEEWILCGGKWTLRT
ncbi:uncharacterized protein LOC62_03G003914 [Vanrija pseudolonga]|uniref:Uncharacterized protein n=1 Tax=Vanrija pseudolonga TaxID=143232 RepID=A0AAF1BHK4_9TREE|nr:hypothetical protein LOC62_03G003914 [Vanrija pseudolonga]